MLPVSVSSSSACSKEEDAIIMVIPKKFEEELCEAMLRGTIGALLALQPQCEKHLTVLRQFIPNMDVLAQDAIQMLEQSGNAEAEIVRMDIETRYAERIDADIESMREINSRPLS